VIGLGPVLARRLDLAETVKLAGRHVGEDQERDLVVLELFQDLHAVRLGTPI